MNRFVHTRSNARTGSAISVVNALATGKGSTIGIDIECTVIASLEKSKDRERIVVKSAIDDRHNLISKSAETAISRLGVKITDGFSLCFKVNSKIPQAVGLKSSSAVSLAVVRAVFDLAGKKFEPKSILDASCTASKLSGASLTGAYDDAVGCLLGGFALTDNSKFKIIKHGDVPRELGTHVLILIPKRKKKFTSDVDLSVYSKFKSESAKAFEYALRDDVASAMLLNSMVQCVALNYSFQPISEALGAGASAAGITGKGPAIAALCSRSKDVSRVKKAWLDNYPGNKVLETRVVQLKRADLRP